jgi:hypothetical protein
VKWCRNATDLDRLHEQHVSHIQLPHVVFVAKLDRFAEENFHLGVVLEVPVDFGLGDVKVTAQSASIY